MSALTHGVTVALFIVFGGTAAHGQTGTVVASVRTTLADGEIVAIPGVRVTVTCGSGAAGTNLSDEGGRVRFEQLPIGSCSLVTDIQGFRSVWTTFEVAAPEPINLSLSLEPEPMYTGLMVIGPPPEGPTIDATSDPRSRRSTCGPAAEHR